MGKREFYGIRHVSAEDKFGVPPSGGKNSPVTDAA
jgi:hypothetical protein